MCGCRRTDEGEGVRMKKELLSEIERLYKVEKRFDDLLHELGQIIVNKHGNKPFSEIYNEVVIRYLFEESSNAKT